MGDHRLVAVSVRKIETITDEVLAALKIPKVMDFAPITDDERKLDLTGVLWQEGGAGDCSLSVAILFGIGVGNQGVFLGLSQTTRVVYWFSGEKQATVRKQCANRVSARHLAERARPIGE